MKTTSRNGFCHIFSGCAIFLVGLLASSCDSGNSTVTVNADNVVVSVPTEIREIRAVSSNSLQLVITADGTEVRRTSIQDENVSITVQIPADQPVDLGLEWFALVGGERVLLAVSSATIPEDEEEPVITIANYVSSGEARFDFDGDGWTNLEEARDNRNLLSEVDFVVPFSTANFMSPNLTIVNDGRDGTISGDPIEPDRDSTFSLWHDGSELNLFFCGQDETLSESSNEYWHDDTVFVYLDGQNDDGSVYDEVDDYQLAFVRSTEELIATKGAGNPGCPNAECITYQFLPGTASCQYRLTARFPLQSMNITADSTFGFDIEFTDDDNGGLREDAAQWIGYDDESDVDPSTFGTLQLQ